MNEFELALWYKGKDILLLVKLLHYGTSYKLEVDLEGLKVLFELDEELNRRALISYEDLQAEKTLDKGLLELIASELDTVLKK